MAVMITTDDNPYDPRDQFAEWFQWDVEQGYNTCAYLARVVGISPEDPQSLTEHVIEAAIDEIIEMHSGGIYKKLPVPSAA